MPIQMRLMLLLFCAPAVAGLPGEPAMSFAPMTNADGSKAWRFVGPWSLSKDETALINAISYSMANAQWCPNGWVITSRQKASGFLMVEGRCK